jgi:4-amino-4-deoxy-L-arabinose transferase-like glycosyltransferase
LAPVDPARPAGGTATLPLPRERAPRRLLSRATWLARAAGGLGPAPLALLVGAVGLAARAFLLGGHHQAAPGGDSGEYLALGGALAHGQGFVGDVRHPGYPALIAALHALPGRTEDAVVVFQHLLGVGVAAAVALVGMRLFGRAAGVLAGAAVALMPATIGLEDVILSDFVFGAAAFAAAVLLAESVTRPRPVLLAAAGVVLAAAIYVKPDGVFLLAAPPLAFAFRAVVTRQPRPAALHAGIVLLATLLALSPWVARNAIRYGHVSMSVVGGREPFKKVFQGHDPLQIPAGSSEGALVRQTQRRVREGHELSLRDYVARMGPRLSEFERLTLAHPTDRVGGLAGQSYMAFRLSGMSEAAAHRSERRVAFQAIRREPGGYLRIAAQGVAYGYRSIPRNDQWHGLAREIRGRPPVLRRATLAAWTVGRWLAHGLWLVSFAGLGTALLFVSTSRRAQMATATLASVWLAGFLGHALLAPSTPRYFTQLAPLSWLLLAAGAARVVTMLWRGRRGPAAAAP